MVIDRLFIEFRFETAQLPAGSVHVEKVAISFLGGGKRRIDAAPSLAERFRVEDLVFIVEKREGQARR